MNAVECIWTSREVFEMMNGFPVQLTSIYANHLVPFTVWNLRSPQVQRLCQTWRCGSHPHHPRPSSPPQETRRGWRLVAGGRVSLLMIFCCPCLGGCIRSPAPP